MTLPLYPNEPTPQLVTPWSTEWPTISQQFDSVYSQARSLTNRPIRGWAIHYKGVTVEEKDVVQMFFDEHRGPGERFEYLVHLDLLRDPGFELAMDADYLLSTTDLGTNLGFESGATEWSSAGQILIVSDAGNARTGTYVAKKLIQDSTAQQINVVATAKTYTRLAGSYLTDGFVAGMSVTVSGFTNAGNNGVKIVESVTALVMTMTVDTGLVDETGGGDEQIIGSTAADALENAVVFDARPRELFYIEAWVKSSAAADGDARPRIRWIDETGMLLSTGEGGPSGLAGPQTTYTRVAGFVRAPVGAIAGVLGVVVEAHTTGTWYVDDLFIRRYPRAWYQPTPYQWTLPFLTAGARTGGAGVTMASVPSVVGEQRTLAAAHLIPVVSGERMVLSGWSKASGAGAMASILATYYTAAGSTLGSESADGFALAVPTFWGRRLSAHTVPGTAAYAAVFVRTDDTSTAAVTVNFDDLSLRRFVPCRFASEKLEWTYEGYGRFSGTVLLAEAP